MNTNSPLHSNDYTPLFIQIYNLLCSAIEEGVYKPGDRLPSENELIEKYSVSRTTALAAIDELLKAKIAYRERGKGTFVAKPVIDHFSFQKSFTEAMLERGLHPSSKMLFLGKGRPDPETLKKLKIPEALEYYKIVRLRLADEMPVALQQTYLPIARFPDLLNKDFEKRGLFEILRQEYSINPAWSESIVEASLASAEEADLLQISDKGAVLAIWHLTLDDRFEPIEYVRSVYRSDRFSFATGRSPISVS